MIIEIREMEQMIQGDSVMSEKLKVKDGLSRNDDIREKSRKRSLRTKNSRAAVRMGRGDWMKKGS